MTQNHFMSRLSTSIEKLCLATQKSHKDWFKLTHWYTKKLILKYKNNLVLKCFLRRLNDLVLRYFLCNSFFYQLAPTISIRFLKLVPYQCSFPLFLLFSLPLKYLQLAKRLHKPLHAICLTNPESLAIS